MVMKRQSRLRLRQPLPQAVDPRPQFIPKRVKGRKSSLKVECVDCGREGYEMNGKGWQRKCVENGHAPCPTCGKIIVRNNDGSPSSCRGGRHGGPR